MKTYKILSLVTCMLIITTAIPVVAFSLQTSEPNNLNFSQPYNQAPTPGYASTQPSDLFIEKSTLRQHPEKTVATMDDIIINMLTQVNETIYLQYLENITGFGPRLTNTPPCQAAAEYIYNQFKSMGLAVRYHHWNSSGYSADNVEATLEGTDESSDEIYIVCAHYDTVAPSPGADDDGSGTVAVLLTAFIMSQKQYKFNYTIKFVTFSGEEEGLLGSRAYANSAADQGWNIIGVLNADMISYAESSTDGKNLIVFQNDESEWLFNYTNSICFTYYDYIKIKLENGGFTWGSDHYYFWQNGYSAIFYYEYKTTPYYHTSGDTIENINKTYAVKNVRLILATLAELAEVYLFSTPPEKPILTGAEKGAINEVYNLTIITTEPDGEDIFYYIDWGDGQAEQWIGPYQSDVSVIIPHQWNKKGTYTIKAKAKDINEVESDWGTLSVVMPTKYVFSLHDLVHSLLTSLLNRLPLLRNIIQY